MAFVTPIQGGCACGAVRYECSAAPLMGGFCCCRNCQRATGSAMWSALIVSADAFRLTKGEPRFHQTTGDSGNVLKRAFCSDCGSPLFARPEGAPVYSLAVGSLDDPAGFEPSLVLYKDSAHPWTPFPTGLPQFAKMPPR
jgi:hypothetical protein